MKINQQKQIKAFLAEEFGTTRNLQSNRQHNVMCPAALEIFVFEETKGKTGAYLEK